MKVIFCLTTARSGTEYLTYLFRNNIKNCVSKHEPIPTMFGKPIYWYYEGKTDEIRKVFKKKVEKIYGYNTKVYVETNHAFLLSFSDVAMEFFPEMKLIHLIRDPLKMAKSGLNRFKQIRKYHFPCYYKGDDGRKYFKWILTGKEDIFKNFNYDWKTIYYLKDERKIFEFLILYWIELENRAIAFLDKYKKHNDCYTLQVPEDLNDVKTLKDMFDFFELELKQEYIDLRGRKHKGAKPTIVTKDDKNQLDEILKKNTTKIFTNISKETLCRF
ncbi:MAG: hypothetical protein QHH19_05010 [Candidatus Thermoplasmatota archaeon]|jgi:hypothetical protein|nr:hypothetical protein [Candidatus Thermoplasmatota archaeon]